MLVFFATIATWAVDTNFPSVAGFIATWSLYAFGVAFVNAGGVRRTAQRGADQDAGLASGLLDATRMLSGALGATLSGAQSGLPTTTLGLLALIGGVTARPPATCYRGRL